MIKNIATDEEKAKNYKLNNDVDFDVKMFISKKDTTSTTIKVQTEKVPDSNILLVDDPGFSDTYEK